MHISYLSKLIIANENNKQHTSQLHPTCKTLPIVVLIVYSYSNKTGKKIIRKAKGNILRKWTGKKSVAWAT